MVKETTYCGSDDLDGYTIVEEYDEVGNVVKRERYDDEGIWYNTALFKYDAAGKLIQETLYYEGGFIV